MGDFSRYGFCGVLGKPYRMAELAAALAAALGESESAGSTTPHRAAKLA